MNKRYKSVRITIAFNPVTEEFATLTPVIAKKAEWISDISELFNATSTYSFVKAYFEANPHVDQIAVEANIARLEAIKNAQIGIISLNDDLDVETVSEIFIRINSKGVPLSSADFAMSKIATYGERGRNIRKLIDYFCHLAVAPHAYADIQENDAEFAATSYLKAIAWLKDDADDLYDPAYSDIIRSRGYSDSAEARPRRSSANYPAETLRPGRSTRTASRLHTIARSSATGDREEVPLRELPDDHQVGRLHCCRHDRI